MRWPWSSPKEPLTGTVWEVPVHPATRPCLVVVLSEPYTARFGESFQFEGVLALLLDSGERPAGDVSPWNVSWFSKKSGSRRIA